jgi:polygalacturonase
LNIQAAIDALPINGGKVSIPEGYHPGSPLLMRSGVILEGSGHTNTVIPPIAASQTRIEGLGLRDLSVNGAFAPGAYGIDWRNVSTSDIRQVTVYSVAYGLIMTGPSYYNHFTGLYVDASNTAVELSAGANQNTFIGGKWSAPQGLAIYSCNGTTLIGTSLEAPIQNMVFKTIVGDDGSTSARGVRMEDANHSSVYWNT